MRPARHLAAVAARAGAFAGSPVPPSGFPVVSVRPDATPFCAPRRRPSIRCVHNKAGACAIHLFTNIYSILSHIKLTCPYVRERQQTRLTGSHHEIHEPAHSGHHGFAACSRAFRVDGVVHVVQCCRPTTACPSTDMVSAPQWRSSMATCRVSQRRGSPARAARRPARGHCRKCTPQRTTAAGAAAPLKLAQLTSPAELPVTDGTRIQPRLSIYPAFGNHLALRVVYLYAIKHSVAAVIPVSPYLSMRAFFWR